MRMKFTLSLALVLMVLACTGQRNIDYEDRQARLGVEPPPPGENDSGSSEGPKKLTLLFLSELLQINHKTLSITLSGYMGSSTYDIQYSFLVDLESNEIYAIDSSSNPFPVGQINCLRKNATHCEKFSYKSSIATFEKLGRFPTQTPANDEGVFELEYEALDTKFGLYQAGPQTLLDTYSVATAQFVGLGVPQKRDYFLHGTYDPLADFDYFFLKNEDRTLIYRFRCPTRSSAWSLVRDRRTNLKDSMFLSCTYLKNDDKTTAVESFSLEYVQN